MVVKKKPEGANILKKDLQSGNPQQLYIIYGDEDYLKSYYLHEIETALVDEAFAEFNLIQLEGKGLLPENLTEGISGNAGRTAQRFAGIYLPGILL